MELAKGCSRNGGEKGGGEVIPWGGCRQVLCAARAGSSDCSWTGDIIIGSALNFFVSSKYSLSEVCTRVLSELNALQYSCTS